MRFPVLKKSSSGPGTAFVAPAPCCVTNGDTITALFGSDSKVSIAGTHATEKWQTFSQKTKKALFADFSEAVKLSLRSIESYCRTLAPVDVYPPLYPFGIGVGGIVGDSERLRSRRSFSSAPIGDDSL